jgi:transposase
VFFVDDVVESLDLRAFQRRYAAVGEHAFPPRLLLKLWLFGAIAGVYSGREIARRVHWDLRFRYLAGSLRPDFRTINRFRVRHREDFAEVLRVRIGRAAGLAKLGRVAIDGTKVRANTSRHKAMSQGRMEEAEARLEDEVNQLLAQIEERNRDEDDRRGRRGGRRAARGAAASRAAKGADPRGAGAALGGAALRRWRQRVLVAVGREGKQAGKWPKGRATQRMHRMLRLPWARELRAAAA